MLKGMLPIFLLLLALLTSCQSQVELHISANKNLNPDVHRNNSEPVSVQVYQLKDIQKFKIANFFQITDEPEKTLGADFLPPISSFILSPNQKQDIFIKLNSEAKYFGIIAAFQFIDNSKWKAIVPIEGKHKKNIHIELKDRSLIIN